MEVILMLNMKEAYGFEVVDERMHICDFTLDMTLVLKDTNIGNELIIVPWYTKVYSMEELESL